MSYATIYYYGLLFSFFINLFVLYANIYHNDEIDKSQYKNMVLGHYVLLICSWVGVFLYIMSLIINLIEFEKDKRNKKK